MKSVCLSSCLISPGAVPPTAFGCLVMGPGKCKEMLLPDNRDGWRSAEDAPAGA